MIRVPFFIERSHTVRGLQTCAALSSLIMLTLLDLPIFAQTGRAPQFNLLKAPLLRVDYLPVSARPAAMGNAFIAAAQDESAAPINPAGLTYMRNAGVSLNQHLSRTDYEPPGFRVDADNAPGVSATRFEQSMVGVFVPFNKKNITIALYRQVVLDTELSYETQSLALPGSGIADGHRVNLDYKLINDALSFGVKINRRLSIGVAGKLTALKIDLHEQIYAGPEGTRNNAGNLDSFINVRQRLSEPGFSCGLMADLLPARLYFGLVYHYNPSYRLGGTIIFPTFDTGDGIRAADERDLSLTLNIPDVYGAGLYYLPYAKLRLTFDLVRTLYAQLQSGEPSEDASAEDPSLFRPGNATEVHFGVEYLAAVPELPVLPLQTIYLRAGLFSDPGQQWSADGDTPISVLFPKKASRLRYTFGVGLQITRHLKIDAAVVAAGDRVEALGSALISVRL
jgi:hypothetical protein